MHKLQIIQIEMGLAPPRGIQGDRRSDGHCMLWHHHIQPQRLPVLGPAQQQRLHKPGLGWPTPTSIPAQLEARPRPRRSPDPAHKGEALAGTNRQAVERLEQHRLTLAGMALQPHPETAPMGGLRAQLLITVGQPPEGGRAGSGITAQQLLFKPAYPDQIAAELQP